MEQNRPGHQLNLLAGETVEVRNKEEILSTLDENGRLEGMPFMPEMLQYCEKRFRVFKRADKTCDNIGPPDFPMRWSIRRVKNAVHLTGVRCDGSAHGNCDAGCLIFWNEAWLKKVEPEFLHESQVGNPSQTFSPSRDLLPSVPAPCTLEVLQQASCHKPESATSAEPTYSCQATDLRKFTSHLYWWDFRQYLRDVRSGNLNRRIGNSKSEEVLESLLSILEVFRSLLILAFNKLQGIRAGVQYPHIQGSLAMTPTLQSNLQPGEFVQVKSKEEILETLDRRNKNRGLLFDSEMVRYCGGTFRILKRVNQIVDERTGKMLPMRSPCIILEGVSCVSEYHQLCPRAIYHYWREAWLRKVE
jgi:hypothetical protein